MSEPRKILLVTKSPAKLCANQSIDPEKFQVKVLGNGYRYFHASSHIQGMEQACLQQPSLIVLEHEPNVALNALEFCRQIKASPLTASIPVLIYSRSDSLEDLNTAYMLGASFYFCLSYPPKPSENLAELFDSCLRIIDNHSVELKRRNSQLYDAHGSPSQGIRLSPLYN